MSEPLTLFWWNGKPNFGDAISAAVVAHVSGREVVHAPAANCDLFAVGSILLDARRANGRPRADGSRPWVWCSGCFGPQRTDFVPNMRFASVRGPITQELLNLPPMPYGDPGLLIAEVLGEDIDRVPGRVGVVPHWSMLRPIRREGRLAALSDLTLIDPRGDWRDVVRAIASCEVVFSASLHGLIVADAFGVPNVWLDPTGIHKDFPRLKFYDYAASLGRPIGPPVALEDIPKVLDATGVPSFAYADAVSDCVAAIRNAFPSELRAA